jgi:hypothetical protein
MNRSRARVICWQIFAVVMLVLTLGERASTQDSSLVRSGRATRLAPAAIQIKPDSKVTRTGAADAAAVGLQDRLQKNRIVLRAGRKTAQIGDVVSFAIKHSPDLNNSSYQFQLDYGDGNKELLSMQQPQKEHAFWSTGTFRVILTLASSAPAKMMARVRPMLDSVFIRVDGFSVVVSPEVPRAGDDVKFIVPVSSAAPGRMYRFFLREVGVVSPWSALPEFHYSFPGPGTFSVSAEIGRQAKAGPRAVAATDRREFRVLPPVPPSPAKVDLHADRLAVIVGAPVVFTAFLDHPSDQVRYQFNFDDGTTQTLQRSDSVTHWYASPRRYVVTVAAFSGDVKLVSQPVAVVVSAVESQSPTRVTARADRSDVLVDTLVTFTASVDHPSDKIKYRFIFGDGHLSEWQSEDFSAHHYENTGEFMASVQASYSEGIIDSKPILVRVSSIPVAVPPWEWLAIGAAVLSALGLGVRPIRERIMMPRVTILVRSRSGATNIKSFTPPGIEVRTVLRSKFREGHTEVSTKDHSLIRSVWRKHV